MNTALTVTSMSDMDMQVNNYVIQGYHVANKTNKTATLIKKKEFNWLIAGLGFFFVGIGFFIYLGYYTMKKDTLVMINLKEESAVA